MVRDSIRLFHRLQTGFSSHFVASPSGSNTKDILNFLPFCRGRCSFLYYPCNTLPSFLFFVSEWNLVNASFQLFCCARHPLWDSSSELVDLFTHFLRVVLCPYCDVMCLAMKHTAASMSTFSLPSAFVVPYATLYPSPLAFVTFSYPQFHLSSYAEFLAKRSLFICIILALSIRRDIMTLFTESSVRIVFEAFTLLPTSDA